MGIFNKEEKEKDEVKHKENKTILTEKVKVSRTPSVIYVLLAFFFISSIVLSIKALFMKEAILYYVVAVLFFSVIFSGILLLLVIINKTVIFTNLKIMLGRSVGYGKVKILQNNGYFNVFIKKFSEDGFLIGGCQYRYDAKRAYNDADGDKCIFYREGDVEPIDITNAEIPIIDGKLYAQALAKAMSAGALSVQQDKIDYGIYVSGLTLFCVGIAILLIFKNYDNITTILQAVT